MNVIFSVKIKQNIYNNDIIALLLFLCAEVPEIVVHPSKEEAPAKIPGKKSTVETPSPSKSQSGHVDKYDHDVM
jgi:hypothetical protein